MVRSVPLWEGIKCLRMALKKQFITENSNGPMCLKEYRSYLEKQIEDMKAAGIGGFIIHARTGLKEEYLGEKWFSCVKTCLKKAEDLDMKA